MEGANRQGFIQGICISIKKVKLSKKRHSAIGATQLTVALSQGWHLTTTTTTSAASMLAL